MSRLGALPWGLGVIEGFYGRAWPDTDRLDTLGFLAGCGYRYYVYAPKSDSVLRRDWTGWWEPVRAGAMRRLAQRAADAGLLWGVGLSPLGLVEDMSPAAVTMLRAKIARLDDLGVDLLCILFDDMPRGVDDLAARQCAVVAEVAGCTRARHLMVCPSYYSRDPVLERVFGARPDGYWEQLGAGLPTEAGIFWTGERVCSSSYPPGDLLDIRTRFGRRPVLWDNYPVNDGARMADHLHIDAFRCREPELRDACTAHFVNPMNQCRLSWIPLATLPESYARGAGYDPGQAFADAAQRLVGATGARWLREDLELLQHTGLTGIGEPGRARLLARYGTLDAPWARELVGWLHGDYAFDPACLTD